MAHAARCRGIELLVGGDDDAAARQRELGLLRVVPFDMERLTDAYLDRYRALLDG